MCGSFNNYAHKVRNSALPLSVRATALRSCVLQYCYTVHEPSYTAMIAHLEALTGAGICHDASAEQLLEALGRLERNRNQILEVERAYARKRIRQKLRGRRTPSKAQTQALQDAFDTLRRNAKMLPEKEPETQTNEL